MADIFQTKQQLLQIIRDKLIPWAHSAGVHSCILAKSPLHVPPNVSVMSLPTLPLLKTREGRSYFCLTEWVEAKLEALRFPYLGCVFEGEADLTVGNQAQEPGAIAQKKPGAKKKRLQKIEDNARQTVFTVPACTFIIYPPGVPHEAGGKLHWMRPHPERAHAKIFWMNVVPAGVICHTCTTVKGQHTAQNSLFLHDPHLLTLTNFLMEELAGRNPRYELIAQSYLLALLGRLERGISIGTVLPANEVPHINSSEDGKHVDADNVLVVQRACQYIQSHLHEPLSPSVIAQHSYISAPHLMRLFRLKQSTTVMQYVASCRIDQAKLLLQDTDLPVGEIGRLVGYPNKPHFSHVFSDAAGASPLKYRKEQTRRRS